MSTIVFGCDFSSSLNVSFSHKYHQTRSPMNSSMNLPIVKCKSQSIFLSSDESCLKYLVVNTRRVQRNGRRSLAPCSMVQPGAPPPSEPPYNFLNWITKVVLPFLTLKWATLLKLKNEVETAVERIEEIVDAVEKVAEEVEKVAEDISDDLPQGGRLREVVDFVENVAERASKDAHLVGDLIDKVQEAEEKVESAMKSLPAMESLGDEYSHTSASQLRSTINEEINKID